MTFTADDIRAVEFRGLRAWQAPEEIEYDGWLLRFAGGYTRRANSVNPIHASTLDLDVKIAHCEAVYAARSQPCIFRLHPAVADDLESLLAGHGYRREVETPVLVRALSDLGAVAEDESRDLGETLAPAVTDEWLAAYARFNQRVDDGWHRRVLESIEPTTIFVTTYLGAIPVAIAVGVVEQEWVGIFDVTVDPAHRRRGIGSRVVRHVMRWGVGHGATGAYLQVFGDNAAALAMYEALGFGEAYRYWYRVHGRG